MKSNTVTLIGYVGNHLASTATKKGTHRVAIRIATHHVSKDADGRKIYHTTWHDVVAWDQTAAYAERSLVKGSKVMVEGSIEYRSFFRDNGKHHKITRIRACGLLNLDR